ncbi:hypothetical protein KTO58_07160 [Chitinophaga pendula]|uniref:hypothetical protein n=1 Tax=Chitinophaga TaxID=79328 RepID=UPI0012FD4EF5|nr:MULTISPECIES: hypothetical protein [Chitinophaga]UCJ08955.1 hypothetical protein KTO58_07160 [Chitinophaga pendula]
MKISLAPMALGLLILAGCTKQLADTAKPVAPGPAGLMKATSQVSTPDVFVDANNIPHYKDSATFMRIQQDLAEAQDAHEQSQSVRYARIDTFPEDKYAKAARTAADENDKPEEEYEEKINLISMRAQVKSEVSSWLDRQAQSSTLDTSSYPDKTGTDVVFKAMINADGNYGVGDTLYHIERDQFIILIPGVKNTPVLDTIKALQLQGRDKLINWLRSTDPSRGIIFWPDPIKWPFGRCRNNVSAQNWVQIDAKHIVMTSQSWHHSFLFTAGIFKTKMFRKLSFGWVPSLEVMKSGLDVYHYDPACGGRQHRIVTERFAWGIGTERRTYVMNKRNIAQPIIVGNTPVDGFWGIYRARNMNIVRFAPLNF